jgi:hypothetical protein
MKKSNLITIILSTIIILFTITGFAFGDDALYVSPTGFVGIGSSNPANMLQMHDADNSGYNFTAYTNGNSGSTSNDGFVVGGSTYYVSFCGWVWNREAGPLFLGTNNTYRVSISASGNVLVGYGTQDTYTFAVAGTAGKTGGGSWSSYSDIRLKKDIKELTNATDLISGYPKPITYKWKNPEEHENQSREIIGLSAQELEEVNPEMVSEGEIKDNKDADLTDGKVKSIYYSNEFFALQLGAVQELIDRVDALETENQAIRKELCIKDSSSSFCN